MLVDWQPRGSTGGIALTYAPCMRNVLMTLPLSILLLACGDDGEPTRPVDGTVKVWESCVWDGQITFELCEPGLLCSWHGICSPKCEAISDCPAFDGFDNECLVMKEDKICKPVCNAKQECPATDAAPLECFQGYCEGSI